MEHLYTRQEAADYLGIDYPAITYLAATAKHIPVLYIGKSSFFHKEDIHAYKKAQDILAELRQRAQNKHAVNVYNDEIPGIYHQQAA